MKKRKTNNETGVRGKFQQRPVGGGCCMFNYSCKTVVYNRLTEMNALPLNRYANVTPAALYEGKLSMK